VKNDSALTFIGEINSFGEDIFLTANLQVVKLVAKDLRMRFPRAIRVWYTFPVTGIFATNRQTDVHMEKAKDETRSTEGSTSFLRDSS
jgi:hypothetical protein